MKILHVTPDFPSEYFVGGQGVVVLESSRPLVRRGIEVSVLTARKSQYTLWNKLQHEECIDGVNVIRLETREWPQHLFGFITPPPILDPMGFFQALPFLVRSDVIHFHNFWFGGFLLPLFFTARAIGKKIVFTPFYEDFAKVNPRDSASYYRFLEILSKNAWRTTVISEREKWRLLEFTDSITKIPLGIDLQKVSHKANGRHKAPHAPMLLLTVGNACERKNYLTLIEALSRVSRPWKLVIKSASGADKNYMRLCQKKAAGLGLADKIEWITRYMSDEELDDLYSSASLFIMPSLWESFSLAALEAMARGIPTILSQGCMITEYFKPDREVIVVTPDDSSAWADAIQRVLDDSGAARRMAQAARKRITDYFTWDRVAEDFLGIYQAALAEEQLDSARESIDPASVSPLISPGHDKQQLCNGWLPQKNEGEFLMRERSSFILALCGKSKIVATARADKESTPSHLQLTLDGVVLGETPALTTKYGEYSFELPPLERGIGCGVLRTKWTGAACPEISIRKLEAL